MKKSGFTLQVLINKILYNISQYQYHVFNPYAITVTQYLI